MAPPSPDPSSPREFEIKFDLPADAAPALEKVLAGLGGRAASKALSATYFDTAGGDLAKAGFSLRLRQAGKQQVQTLKRDEGRAFERGEWEMPAVGDAPSLDGPHFEAVRELVQQSGPLTPRYTNRVTRRQRTVSRDGATIEIAFDRGETEAEGRTAPLTELELELKQGDPRGLFALARALSEAAPLRLSFLTKAGRGAELLTGEAPQAVKSTAAPLSHEMTAGEAFTALAGGCLRQIVVNERVLREYRRPEALHQMRVGLRRLRSALSMFKGVVADGQLEAIQCEARWLTKRLDATRDLDVFLFETFRPAAHHLGEGEGGGAFGRRLLRAQTLAYDKTLEALGTPRALAFPLLLAEWIHVGDWTRDAARAAQRDQPVARFAEATLDRLRRKVRRKGRGLVDLDPEARHDVRIAVKKLRYGLEFFASLYPPRRVRPFSKILKTLQDSLGGLNDIAVGRRTAAEVARGGGAGSGDVGFAAGLLVGLRAQDEATQLAAAATQRKQLLRTQAPWRT